VGWKKMNSKGKRQNDKIKRRKQRVEKRNYALERKREKEDNKIKIKIGPYNKDIIPEKFVSEVINCLHSIRLNNRELFSKDEENVFKLMKEIGVHEVARKLVKYDNTREKYYDQFLLFKMGDTVFEQLKNKNILLNYIPYSHVNIMPIDKEFLVIFRALLKHKSKFGTVYYSSLKPTIKIDNKEYIVAFSRHAIERICERSIFDWKTFLGANDAFLYLERCIKYDLIEESGGYDKKYFITFYEPCSPESGNMVYVNKVLNEIEINTDYCFRIGYCPIQINDNFACAITLLTPGMKGTPEDLLIKNSDLSYEDKIRIRNNVQDMISKKIWDEKQNFEAIKWFHQNGIPQVLKIKEKIFEKFYEQYLARVI
jgi:hypothetical protein